MRLLLKIIIGQTLALTFSFFLVNRVFFPGAPIIRPAFKASLVKVLKNPLTGDRAVFPSPAPPRVSPSPQIPSPSSFLPPIASPTPADFLPPPTISALPSPTVILPKSPTPTLTLQNPLTREEAQMVELINSRRAGMGLSVLTVSEPLVAAARRHTRDTTGCSGHVGSDGSTPLKRAREAGYTGNVYGETVGCYPDPASIVEAWWQSPDHFAILTHERIRVIGVGWRSNPTQQTALVGD